MINARASYALPYTVPFSSNRMALNQAAQRPISSPLSQPLSQRTGQVHFGGDGAARAGGIVAFIVGVVAVIAGVAGVGNALSDHNRNTVESLIHQAESSSTLFGPNSGRGTRDEVVRYVEEMKQDIARLAHDPVLAQADFDAVYASIESDADASYWLDQARQVHTKEDLREFADEIYRDLIIPNTSAQTAEQFKIALDRLFANWEAEAQDWKHDDWVPLVASITALLGVFVAAVGLMVAKDP